MPSGSHLTFSAGSTVEFKTVDDFNYDGGVNGGFLNIKGKLTANGTSSNHIAFTSEGASDYWGSVVLNGDASNSVLDGLPALGSGLTEGKEHIYFPHVAVD